MDGFDYGFWGFVLGAIGTIISSSLVIIEIIDRFREPSETRVRELRPIFAALRAPLSDMKKALVTNDQEGLEKSGDELIRTVLGLRGAIRILEKTIEKESRPIHDRLISLVSRVDTICHGVRALGDVWQVVRDDEVKKLVPSLADKLNEWTEKNA